LFCAEDANFPSFALRFALSARLIVPEHHRWRVLLAYIARKTRHPTREGKINKRAAQT
jgi:hypothetical protein